MRDTSLLEKDGAISIEDLKKHFQKNDFSAEVSHYNANAASSENNELYLKVKQIFQEAWNKEMQKLTKKKSLMNFSEFHPVRCLEEREEDLVSGTVMELLADETQLNMLLDLVFAQMHDKIVEALEAYAATKNKTVDALTETQIALVVDKFADQFLAYMMQLLLQVQSVPEIMEMGKDMPAMEDYADTGHTNYDRIDGLRKLEHLRTQLGGMLSLSDVPKDASTDIDRLLATMDTEQRKRDDAKYDRLLQTFCKTLKDDVDRQIVYMCDEGLNQTQIAEKLGFANHSAVSKRIAKIYKKCCAFLEAQPIEETEI